MNDVLFDVIEKALNNGFDMFNGISLKTMSSPLNYLYMCYYRNNKELIFSHEFAKAFFGCERVILILGGRDTPKEGIDYLPRWKYHLRELVLAEDSLKYLEQFLEK